MTLLSEGKCVIMLRKNKVNFMIETNCIYSKFAYTEDISKLIF